MRSDRVLSAALVAASAMVSGSGVAQEAAAPAAATPAAAPATEAPGAPPPAEPAPAEPPSDGGFDFAAALRQGGEPMTADQAAQLAVQSAPSIARARSASARARAAASEALVAVYPRLDLEARYTRLSDQGTFDGGQTTGTIGDPPVPFEANVEIPSPLLDQFMLQARLSYPVSDLFFTIMPRYEATREAARAEELNIKARQQAIALEAREAYYNYARARAAMLVSESALAQSQAQRRDVEAMVAAGALARVELMRADAGVASAQVAVARARGSMALARTALRSLLHRDGGEFAISEDLTVAPPPLAEDRATLLALARQNRSELLALRTMAGVHAQLADASEADGYPKLGIGGNFDFANPNSRASSFEREWSSSWAALANITWSPNDYAASGARADQARADEAAASNDLNALEDTLRLEVAGAHEEYLAASAAMDAARVGIAAAEESYRVRREQFRAGAAVATDVIDSEEELRRARLDLVNAVIDVHIARARLDRAVERPGS